MAREGGIRAAVRRTAPHRPIRDRIGAPVGAALATVAIGAAARAADAGASTGTVDVLPLPLALALAGLALCIGALLAWRGARARHELADALRQAREHAQALGELLDVWEWRSDASHRVVSLRAPRGAHSAAWSAPLGSVAVWELFDSDDAAALRARLDDDAAPLDDVAVHRTAADGSVHEGVLRARRITDGAGRFTGHLGTLRELPRAAAPVPAPSPPEPAAASDAEHESFGFTVSHDLRAPIRVVEGFTKILKEDYGRLLDRVGNDHLDRVLGAATRMNNMIDALLALTRLSAQPLAHQPVNLSQLAGHVADDLRRQDPQRDVQVEIEPGLHAHGDPTLLRVVLENLIGNAWKYTARAERACIAFARHAQRADAFTVRDNGAGFDMRFADRLFGVFQRLHSASDFPGTGVGLASVRRIVRRHGGEIWGEAEVNRGAQFHFSLPKRTGAH